MEKKPKGKLQIGTKSPEESVDKSVSETEETSNQDIFKDQQESDSTSVVNSNRDGAERMNKEKDNQKDK